MKKNSSINYIVSNNLCTGCGLCQDICPQGAIKFYKHKGRNIPFITKSLCKNDEGCSMCYRVCPGKGINLREISKQFFKREKFNFDYYLGYYLNTYEGYSNNFEIRYHSSSGGVLTHFLIFLLDKKIIDGAVITRFKSESPLEPETIIARTREEIILGKGSKYCPVSLNGISSKLKKLKGKYIVVGLPCHIHGFRKYEKIDLKFKKKILGYFSIYCSSTRTYYGTEYLLSYYKINTKDLNYFAYRDDGCLGFMKAITKDKEIKIPYKEYYSKMRSYFKPKRCLLCVDHYGDLADLSFGDLQIGKYKEEKREINSIISRNQYFDELLNQAKDEGVISINYVDKTMVNNSQKTMLIHKRKLASLNLYLDEKIGKIVPKYDIILPFNYTLYDFGIYFIIKIQRLIGKFKSLWFIINTINKIFDILFPSQKNIS